MINQADFQLEVRLLHKERQLLVFSYSAFIRHLHSYSPSTEITLTLYRACSRIVERSPRQVRRRSVRAGPVCRRGVGAGHWGASTLKAKTNQPKAWQIYCRLLMG